MHPTITRTITQSNVCRKVHANYTHVVARCKYPNATTYDLEMKKEMSKAPDWMVKTMKRERRQKCSSSCSPPPAWKTEFSNQPLPQGPEVSYGIPFRLLHATQYQKNSNANVFHALSMHFQCQFNAGGPRLASSQPTCAPWSAEAGKKTPHATNSCSTWHTGTMQKTLPKNTFPMG